MEASVLSDHHLHLGFLSAQARTGFIESALGGEVMSSPSDCARFFSVTCSPEEYSRLKDEYDNSRDARFLWGIGLHPQLIAHEPKVAEARLEHFIDLLHTDKVALIGEVGLDFGAAFVPEKELQLHCFSKICQEIKERRQPSILSLHAQKSSGVILNILENEGLLEDPACKIIFHWFSGSSEELLQARKAKLYFSLGYRMLRSKRGRAYAKSIELTKLLLESDDPQVRFPPLENEEETYPFELNQEHLREALHILAELRGIPETVLEAQLRDNARSLMIDLG